MARMKHISKSTHRNPPPPAKHKILTSSASFASFGAPSHSPSKSPSAKEFYTHIQKVDDQKIYVLACVVPFFVEAINAHFGLLPHDTNTYAAFGSASTYETYEQVLCGICIEGTQWAKKTLNSRVVKWLRLKLDPKLWTYFMNTRLMPMGHHSQISRKRMLLMHSVLEGRYIDVGHLTHKAIVDRTLSKVCSAARHCLRFRVHRTTIPDYCGVASFPNELFGVDDVAHDAKCQPSLPPSEAVLVALPSTQNMTIL
ncbi:hypothetical protein V6N12_013828 [Hibiscus sabdariffa]|uniref:Putative plant transposon protein domain-containing protein n=1 Tax=Hibiscus sabdariffa TaxID=183260 RepID=A0ABR2B8C8_9ROSI